MPFTVLLVQMKAKDIPFSINDFVGFNVKPSNAFNYSDFYANYDII